MISQETLKKVAAQVVALNVEESSLQTVRNEFPDVHFTWCSDDDIPGSKAVLETEKFNLYLIDGREHCLCLTPDLEVATGIVVAEIYPE